MIPKMVQDMLGELAKIFVMIPHPNILGSMIYSYVGLGEARLVR